MGLIQRAELYWVQILDDPGVAGAMYLTLPAIAWNAEISKLYLHQALDATLRTCIEKIPNITRFEYDSDTH